MRLSKPAAFYLQCSIILFFLAGSSAPTPLYPVYQAAWGFTPITITIVFGIYAIAVLASLLTVGSLSDHLGRRPVLLATTLAQAAAMGMFATADGVGALIAARVVQGLATGAAAGAVGAGLVDLDRARGTLANSVAPLIGTGSGALLSGLFVQFLPAPTTLVYLVLAATFVVQASGVALMPETVTRRPGALASLRPSFRIPPAVRGPMLIAASALIATWSLIGFYASLGPALVRTLTGSPSRALGGVAVTVLAAGGVAAVLATRSRPPRTVIQLGTGALVVGIAITLVAMARLSTPTFFAGATLAGAGFGMAFQGAIRSVVPLAEVHERAGVLSVLYVIAYLAMGGPAVLGGWRAVHGGGVMTTAREYGLAVMALAALALTGTLLGRRDQPAAVSATARTSAG